MDRAGRQIGVRLLAVLSNPAGDGDLSRTGSESMHHDPGRRGEAIRPPIVLSVPDHEQLVALAGAVLRRSPQVARLLMEETGRAELVPAARLPEDIVALGSVVDFHDTLSGALRQAQLVLPAAADAGEGRISVLSLVGAGLIGLAAGQAIDWPTQDGRMRRLSVLRVEVPPTGATVERPLPAS
jgi:regulator of nucleoside diphosphate kinase